MNTIRHPFPFAARASYSDNFNRANGGLGANWVETHRTGSTASQIVSNAAALTCPSASEVKNEEIYASALSTSNHHSQVDTLSESGTAGIVLLYVRKPDTNTTRTYYFGQAYWHTGGLIAWDIARYVNNSLTVMASGTQAGAFAGSSIELDANGSTITLTVNGTQHQVTDSNITSGLYCGFGLDQSGATNNYVGCDNWAGADD